MNLFITLLLVFNFSYSNTTYSKSIYSDFLYREKADKEIHKNFEGFVENVLNYIPDKKANTKNGFPEYCLEEVKYFLGKIHNVMVDTFYSCSHSSPKASNFSEAISGKNTPDSHHYAALMHSALLMKGIKTSFFKTPTHYGLYYKDKKTNEEIFWCIITGNANVSPASSLEKYVILFNKNKNEEINKDIKKEDVTFLSPEEFSKQF